MKMPLQRYEMPLQRYEMSAVIDLINGNELVAAFSSKIGSMILEYLRLSALYISG
jgi:hypothetical protein